jgi:hypothetical protein
MITKDHRDLLIMGAKKKFLPTNCFCPGQCKFCYEGNFTKMFPQIHTRYIPSYRKETFDLFYRNFLNYQERNKKLEFNIGQCCIQKIENELQYFPTCDFFNLGLTQNQIETVIQILPGIFYTTGLNVDFKLIKYFSLKYPKQFHLHLSIITFDPSIRRNIMNPNINIENLKKICKVATRPTYYLLYFNKEQILSDVGILNKFSVKNQGLLYVHKLYYNKFSPDCIKNYAILGENDFNSIIKYLKFNDKKLKNISGRLKFSPSSKIYAWTYRKEIGKLLELCQEADSEAIFCSSGAYQLIRSLKKKMHVIPIENSMGGCVDFTIGMTVKSIIYKIRAMFAKGIILRHIYLPGSMFVVKKQFDLNGDSINLIKKEFPNIKIKIISIPLDIIYSTLSLDSCFKYIFLRNSIY